MTYFFETYGCQMNIAESAAAEQKLLARGWTRAESAELCDLAVINTCSVRQTAENRIFGRLGWYAGLKAVRQKKEGAKDKSLAKAAEAAKTGANPVYVAVMGCMAERLLKSLKRDYPVVDFVVGTYAKEHFDDIIDEIEKKAGAQKQSAKIGRDGIVEEDAAYTFSAVSAEDGAFSTFVPIMHGCNNFCTYCIVPYLRGREMSRSVEEILKEIDTLGERNVREITLLGQNVNSYRGKMKKDETGTESEVDFPTLLDIIARHLEKTNSSIGWVRFDSSHPKDLSDSLIDVISKNDVLCKHIHLAVQHGSDRVLKAMNRHYTKSDFLSLVQKIRARIQNVSLTTDVMVGFPGETEEDVLELLDLMEKANFSSAFMYYYNVREGTPAASMANQIPLAEKKARLARVIAFQQEISHRALSAHVGEDIRILVEKTTRNDDGEVLGRTSRDERVAFRAEKSLIGQFATVHLDSLSGSTFRGTLLSKDTK